MIATRRATPSDLEFVRGSWRDSHRMSHTAGPIPMDAYPHVYDALIKRLLEREGVFVVVMHSDQEAPPNDVLGWACVEEGVRAPARVRENGQWVDRFHELKQPLVHYVYVKQPFRLHGVARSLLTAAGVDTELPWIHTFSTAVVAKLRNKRTRAGLRWPATFDPRLARFPKHEPITEE